MSLRTKVFFFGGIILLLVVGLILSLVYKGKLPPVQNSPVNEAVNMPAGAVLPAGNVNTSGESLKKVTAEEVKAVSGEVVIKNLSKNFVERFGSYSWESNFSNFTELNNIVTPVVAQWLKNYPTDLVKKLPEGFNGVSTRVVSQEIETLSADKAVVEASTQREETVNGVTRVYYQVMRVELVKQGDNWLVDGAYWQL